MRGLRELRGAVAVATGIAEEASGLPREALAGGLAVLPVVGALLGGLAGGAGRLVAPAGGVATAAVALAVLAVLSTARPDRGVAAVAGGVGLVALTFARLWAVSALPAAGLPVALGLAAMLGRWAFVVQCYGGYPSSGGLAGRLVGRARLWEFGWASTLAFGATLSLLDAVGLVVLLAAVLVTMAARVLAYQRSPGITEPALWTTVATTETTVLITLAALTR